MFNHRFYSNAQRGGMLTLGLRDGKARMSLSLGFSLPREDFEDASSPVPSPRNARWATLLAHWEGAVRDYKMELVAAGRAPSLAEVREALRGRLLPDCAAPAETAKGAEPSAPRFMDFYRVMAERHERRATRESYEYTAKVVTLLMGDAERVTFGEMNYAWLSELDDAMRRRGFSTNTRGLHFANIRAVCNEAYRRELTDALPFRRFRIRTERTAKRSMTPADLWRFVAWRPAAGQEDLKDYFLIILGLIGINAVDLFGLKGVTADGRVEYRRAKTGRLYSVKVEPEVAALLKKRRGVKGLVDAADRYRDHRSFRMAFNRRLQMVEDERGEAMWPGMTTYWARHTWATLAAELDIPDAVIAQALGHSAAGVTETYIRRNMAKVDEANRRVLDWVLYGKR